MTPVQWAALQERNLGLREPECFILGSKHAYPLPQRERLSLSFKAVCYTNILKKIVQNKGQSASLVTRCAEILRDPWKIVFEQ